MQPVIGIRLISFILILQVKIPPVTLIFLFETTWPDMTISD